MGRHDFAAFPPIAAKVVRETIRTIHSIGISRRFGLIAVTFDERRLSYKMVRMLTGAMVRVARQREELERYQARLELVQMESCCSGRRIVTS